MPTMVGIDQVSEKLKEINKQMLATEDRALSGGDDHLKYLAAGGLGLALKYLPISIRISMASTPRTNVVAWPRVAAEAT
jgi:hypothetical protein